MAYGAVPTAGGRSYAAISGTDRVAHRVPKQLSTRQDRFSRTSKPRPVGWNDTGSPAIYSLIDAERDPMARVPATNIALDAEIEIRLLRLAESQRRSADVR